MITPADTPDQLTEPARPTHAAPGAPLVLVLHGGRGVIGTQEYQDLVRDSLTEFGQEGTGDDDVAALTQHSAFIGEVGEDDPGELPGAIEKARGVLADAAGTDPADVVVVHYLAVPPQTFEPLTRALAVHGMTRGHDGRADTVRVVYEKPYGTSSETFRELDAVVHDVVLGQFEGYRELKSVAEGSTTDTFIAARLWIDNHRWRGVPFLLRTGKRMAASAQRVTLVLRRDPGSLYGDRVPVGRISVSLAGDGAIEVTAAVKRPGPDLDLELGTARLDLDDVDGESLPPYASLLDDVLHGDHTLFTTPAGLADAWRAFAPLLGPDRPQVLPYPPGSWGPAAAAELAGPDGWALGGWALDGWALGGWALGGSTDSGSTDSG